MFIITSLYQYITVIVQVCLILKLRACALTVSFSIKYEYTDQIEIFELTDKQLGLQI